MMDCFCGMVDRGKAFSLISSRDHCHISSSSRISNATRAGFGPAQDMSSGFVEWRCAVVITTTPRRQQWEFGNEWLTSSNWLNQLLIQNALFLGCFWLIITKLFQSPKVSNSTKTGQPFIFEFTCFKTIVKLRLIFSYYF